MTILPDFKTHVTSHELSTGKSVIRSTTPGSWVPLGQGKMRTNIIYSTSEFPPCLRDESDIASHEKFMDENKVGIVSPNGTLFGMIDLAPGFHAPLHRTQSLDYAAVIEGSVELHLDSGERTVLARGDVVVQRSTVHSWKNPSETDWARLMIITQECQPGSIGGHTLGKGAQLEVDGLFSDEQMS